MKIAFLHSKFPGVGGTETVTMNLIPGFKKMGHECVVLSFERSQYPLPIGIDVLFLNKNESHDLFRNNEILIKIVKEENIDLIINQGPFWQIQDGWPYDICKVVSVLHYEPSFRITNIKANINRQFYNRQPNLKKRIISWVRYFFKGFFAHREFLREEKPIIERIVRNSNAFVVLCSEYIAELSNIYSIKDTNKIFAIPNPFSSNNDTYISYMHKEKKLLYVGRLTYWDKRVDRLLRIWGILRSRYPDWSLDIVGDGDDKERLVRLSEDLGLKNVIFHGFKNPKPFYEKASILCLTSESEGFGMVVLEGADFYCPAVAYDVSDGLRSIVRSNENGILVKPFKQECFIKSLDTLMSNHDYRLNLAINARDSLSKFSIEAVCRHWQCLFDSL